MEEEDVACFRSQEKSKMIIGMQKEEEWQERQAKPLGVWCYNQEGKGWWGTTEEPWECVKSNGLDIHLGGSIDETW